MVEDAAHGIARLRALIQPSPHPVSVKGNLPVFCFNRMINAQLFDGTAVPGLPGAGRPEPRGGGVA